MRKLLKMQPNLAATAGQTKTTPFLNPPSNVSRRRVSDTVRTLAHFRVQIADALLPFMVFAPLFVRQAHIGIQFQCLDLLPEKVDKLGLEFFDGAFHTPPTQPFRRISGEEAQTWDGLGGER